MISITHHMDRDGQFLADVSPRRYFCNQCHVPQTEVAPLVDNTFIDIDTILKAEQLDRAKPTTTRGRSPDCDLLIPGDSEHRRLDAAQRAPFAPKKACTC